VNGFLVLRRDPLTATSDEITTGEFVVSRYDSGTAVFPPIQFIATTPGDTVTRVISTNPLMLTVRTVAVDTTKEFRDLKPPLSIPLSLGEILLYAGIVLLGAALVIAAYRLMKKWKAKKAGAADEYAPPPRAAHLIAFEQLAILKEKRLWQQGMIKQYYSEVTEIFRRYLENRYSMRAMEETTDEIMAGLQKLRFPEAMMSEAERILRRADLVKFAKHQPPVSDHEGIFTVVYDFVERTKIVAMAPLSETEVKGAVHAGA
jgi:hypothetical protein